MTVGRISIDEWIKIVAPKLRHDVKKTMEPMRGSDLKLTGYKEVDGKPIDENAVYKIPVPVTIRINHTHKLRLAWLRGGALAIRTYLRKYMKPEDIEKALSVLKR